MTAVAPAEFTESRPPEEPAEAAEPAVDAPAEPATPSKKSKPRLGRQEGGLRPRQQKVPNHNKANELHVAFERQEWRLCKELAHTKPDLLFGKNKNGFTPLMLLAKADWAMLDASSDAKKAKDAADSADKTEYWKSWHDRKRNWKQKLLSELLEEMLEQGAAKTAGERMNNKSAADFAKEIGNEVLATRLRGLEAEQQDLRPVWRWEVLDLFPRRATTLDQHAMMSELPAELLEIVNVYFTHRFPSSNPEVARALRWVWEKHPTSLRVKEFFETIESFVLIAQEIALIRKRAAQEICLPCHGGDSDAISLKEGWFGVDTIFDMACGHGLLGVLLAYRFPGARVVCVDLERREAFDHYIAAFRACGELDVATGEARIMQNVEFVEGDMASVEVPPRSFVVCVHACNEANKTAVEMAQRAGAGYAAMPCCIPNGLYSVQSVRHVDIDTRYAAMVGVMAGTSGAHTIDGIERRITNRHMVMLGGYPCEKKVRASTKGEHHDEGGRKEPEPLARKEGSGL